MGASWAAWLIAALAAACAAGLALTLARVRRLHRTARQDRSRLLDRERENAARVAVDAERARIATELHDIVSHNVSLMVVQVSAAREVLAAASGDGGPAAEAELWTPGGVAVDAAGNLVITDEGNQRVRVVAATTGTFYGQAMTAGNIYTVAGDGAGGPARSGGLAASSSLSQPQAVTPDAAGNLVIADNGYDRVWVVAEKTGTFYGQAMTAGHIYSVAGDGRLVTSGSGGKATNAECCYSRAGNDIAADVSNDVVVGDEQAWIIANKAGTYFGRAMTAGDVYVVAGNGFSGYNGDGRIATSARFKDPEGVAVDKAGNLVIADSGNHRLRVVAAATGTFYGVAMKAGDIYTVAGTGKTGSSGDGGPATKAGLTPYAVAVDKAGNLVIADSGSHRLRVVAAATGTFYGVAMKAGDIYTVAGTGKSGYSGDGGPATAAELAFPVGVAVDAAGNLVIADGNDRIRVVAAASGTFYGVAMTTGDIYTVAGNGTDGFSGDGGPAIKAELANPEGVAVDGAGNLLIDDSNNDRVRQVTG